MNLMFPIPYVPIDEPLLLDLFVSFLVSLLVAVLITAEGQGFAATVLGDVKEGRKDRLHFNAFQHLSLWGTLCFFIAGFGWPKRVGIEPPRFDNPRLYTVLSRFAGPVANFLMANIAASIVWLIGKWGMVDPVFTMVAVVNLSVAVYHIIPIPPLAGASLVTVWFPEDAKGIQLYRKIGPFLLIGIFLLEQLTGVRFVSGLLDPVVRYLFHFVTG